MGVFSIKQLQELNELEMEVFPARIYCGCRC